MSSEREMELWRNHRAMQEKHIYFLLAASGACIGFALTQSKDLSLTQDLIALVGALSCWALSFWMGCRQISFGLAVLSTNMALVKVQNGSDPDVGRHPERMQIGGDILRGIAERHNQKVMFSGQWQYRFLLVGVVFYVLWQVVLMAARTE